MTELFIRFKNGNAIHGFFEYKIIGQTFYYNGYKRACRNTDSEEIGFSDLSDIKFIAEREPDEQTATSWSFVFESDDYVNKTQDIF